MKIISQITRERIHIITTIIAEAVANLITAVFYFTVLVPFSFIAKAIDDPLQKQSKTTVGWLQRDAIPNDIEKARRQG